MACACKPLGALGAAHAMLAQMMCRWSARRDSMYPLAPRRDPQMGMLPCFVLKVNMRNLALIEHKT
eukprot:3004991-Amphidinium_carterae.1